MVFLAHVHHENALGNAAVSYTELFLNNFLLGKVRMGLIKQRNVHLTCDVVTHWVKLWCDISRFSNYIKEIFIGTAVFVALRKEQISVKEQLFKVLLGEFKSHVFQQHECGCI